MDSYNIYGFLVGAGSGITMTVLNTRTAETLPVTTSVDSSFQFDAADFASEYQDADVITISSTGYPNKDVIIDLTNYPHGFGIVIMPSIDPSAGCYNSIAAKIRDLIKADSEFGDIVKYYPYTKTLETAAFPCCFVVKTTRDTKDEELDDQLTEDTLTYQVELYYKSDHGMEESLNKKDHTLKALIRANPSLDDLANDTQCYSSSIRSQYMSTTSLITVLSAKIVVFLNE